MCCCEGVVNRYQEIELPIDYIPVVVEGSNIEWKEAKYYQGNIPENVCMDLKVKYDRTFGLLKMYIDEFNLTYLCYKSSCELINDSSQDYDKIYNLNEQEINLFNKWDKELNGIIDLVHELTNKVNKLLDIKILY